MTSTTQSRLPRVSYLTFPFRVADQGASTSTRTDHIREQVEQVLFTSPGERVFRPEFGFGARQHIFEPNASPLWELAKGRLFGSLVEALAGEIDPKTLKVDVGAHPDHPEILLVAITYTIAALQKEESLSFRL
jgi:hypothetical protein